MRSLLTPPELRGRATLLALLISIGIGAGPFSVGAVNTIFCGERDPPAALGAVLLVAGVPGAVFFASCIRSARRYLAVVEPWVDRTCE